MADSIVQGLFGPTAQQIQQERAATGYSQDLQAVRLDPRQQANLAIRQGGRAFGSQVMAPLLGVQDPELQKAQMAQQLASQFETTTPEGLAQYAQALAQNGAPDLAQMAMAKVQDMQTKAQTMQSNIASIDLKNAQAVKALREPNPGIATLIGKSTPESVAIYQQSGNPADLKLSDKGLSNSNKEKVAEALKANEMIDSGNAEISNYRDMIKNKEVQYGISANLGARISAGVGAPSENALKQQEIESFLTGQVNEVLNSAKGTQARDDALRAERQIKGFMASNSNDGMQKAFEVLQKTKERVKKSNEIYVNSLTGETATSTKQASTAARASTPNAGVYTSVRNNPGWSDASDAEIDAAIKSGKIKTGKQQ